MTGVSNDVNEVGVLFMRCRGACAYYQSIAM